MKTDPEVLELRKEIENFVERKMRTPADFEFLSMRIQDKEKEYMSPTTLKRLWGYIKGGDNTRASTLVILSRFVGYKDWDAFLMHLSERADLQSAPILARSMKSSQLSKGDKIAVDWFPNRYCVFLYLGDNNFRVVESRNSKLQADDSFSCSLFLEGYPLYLTNMVQRGEFVGNYIVGIKKGINGFKLIE